MSRKNWSISWSLNRRIIIAVVVATASLCGIISCGYRITPSAENIGADVRKVFVDSFGNKTSEAKIENVFRSAFIEQFVRGGRFNLVANKGEADAVLSGEVRSMTTAPLSYRKDNLAVEERMTIIIDLSFRTTDKGKIIWMDKEFSGNEFYVLSSRDLSVVDASRRKALVKLARDTAERAYGLMMSGF